MVILVLATVLIACKKNGVTKTIDGKAQVGTVLDESQLTSARTINNKTMVDYIDFPSDPQMTNMNKGLYLYMEGLKELFTQNPALLNTILNNIKQTQKNAIIVTNYLQYNGLCKQAFNTKLAQLCPEKPAGTDHSTSIALELMNYNGQTQYQPVMSLYNNGGCGVNLNDLNLDSGFRMALGTDAPESNNNGNGNTTGQGKLIPTWYFKKNGTIQLEVVSQQEAATSTIPFFIFTTGYIKNGTAPAKVVTGPQPEYVNLNDGSGGVYIINGGCATGGGSGGSGGGSGTGGGNSGVLNSTPGYIYNFGGHIADHFDSYGASNYYYSFAVLDQNDNIKNNQKADAKALKDIPNGYVNCNCYISFDDALLTGPIVDSDHFYFLSYEHDWYASYKNFYVVTANTGVSFVLKFDATLVTEVYQIQDFTVLSSIPQSAVSSNPSGYAAFTMNFFSTTGNSNGHDIQRF